ncbi:uncharacterized protein pcare2 [Enoplosus armatus]|uniref:uncharacterized protein pcare2 n=1 Tax=Enoplosus armatus TaxID=215367 RepID=UPI0039924330
MGCSPSKGKLFSKPESPGPQKAPLVEAPQNGVHSRTVEEESNCLKADERENELPLPTEDHPTKEAARSQLASNATAAQNAEDIKVAEVNDVMSEEIVNEAVQIGKKTEKRKKNKGKRRSSEKQKSSIVHAKVNFPPHMVRAHQAAYAFLNPNISKYETLLGLLDQAAQTQLSLQPMMSALVFRFEEINQALEEMAEEGELMLKEHGDYMALPSGMLGPAVMQAKPSTAMTSPPDPPPDLLQQLLQHSTEKMRLVGGSVQTLGDTTLKEAVEYFSSLSKMLVEKLQAKQAAEQRLAQVLARVEGAAMRKSNPEDSALHSEDSGIGGENESLTGSERHRRHRGSAGSGSCGSGINIRGAFDTNLPNLVGHNEDDEEDEEEEEDDDDDDDEEYEDDVVNGNEGGLVINGNNNNNSWPDSRDDLDVDNLPPPPPEVLMDNSFQSTQGTPGNEERSQEDSVRSLPMINQNTGVSQRLRASVQNVEVLPNRASVRPRSISILPARPVRQDAVMGAQDAEQQPETDLDPEMEKAHCLYQQARKIIHLHNAAESPDKRNIAELSGRKPSPVQLRMGQRHGSNEFYEAQISKPSCVQTSDHL